MKAVKYSFTYNGTGYVIWAWKGDYISLGAGAELGIYRGSSGLRTVDKSLAMYMGMILIYNGQWIIEYIPTTPQWWITGFNPNYLNVKESELIAVIAVRFIDRGMYWAFRNKWGIDSRWSFYDYMNAAIVHF